MGSRVLISKFTRLGFENACWMARQASRCQQAFSKPCLVNLISKDTNLVFSISFFCSKAEQWNRCEVLCIIWNACLFFAYIHFFINKISKPIAGASSITDIVLAPAKSTTAHSLTQTNTLPTCFLAHLSQRLKMSYCDRSSSVMGLSVRRA